MLIKKKEKSLTLFCHAFKREGVLSLEHLRQQYRPLSENNISIWISDWEFRARILCFFLNIHSYH